LSSILTALKKLENEHLQQQEKVQVLSRAVQSQKSKTRHIADFRRLTTRVTFILLAFGLLVGVSIIGWKHISINKKPPPFASLTQDEPPPAAISNPALSVEGHASPADLKIMPVRPESISLPGESMVISDGQEATVFKTIKDKPLGKKKESSLTTLKTEKFVAKELPVMELKDSSVSSDQMSPPEDGGARKDSFPKTELNKMNETAKKTPGPTPQIPVRSPDDTQLKLQAIAWSDNPTKRIAVINGRIIREGDMIDGVVVTRIDENEVILREGNDAWKLIFNLQ